MDALLTLLISESVNSESVPRRRAAATLVRTLRWGGDDAGAAVRNLLSRVTGDEEAEIIALCDLYAIGH